MTTTTTTRYANFTFVDGVRNHEYELHATGCRDLRKIAASSVRWSVDAESYEAAAAEFAVEAPQAQVFVQACCNPNRMAAAGRWFSRTVEVDAAEPVADADFSHYISQLRFPAPPAVSKRAAKKARKANRKAA